MDQTAAQMPFRDYASLFRLDDQVHVVFGAGQGIGQATALALRALGGQIVCVDRATDRAQATAALVSGLATTADITSEEEVIRTLELARAEYGRMDGVVDVVGGGRFVSVRELDAATWDAQFDANLRHAYFIGRHAGIKLAETGGGAIVFITSIAALFGSATHPAYSAAKLGLVSWVRSLAEEFGPDAVRVNSVAPGATLTDRMSQAWKDNQEVLDDMAAPTVLGRLGRVQEIAGTIAFLLTAASGNVTGQTIAADGGACIRDPVYGGGHNRGADAIRETQKARLASGQPWP